MFLDRSRAARLMRELGLDALVLTGPEAFRYATGGSTGVAGLFRRGGAAFALVPADPAQPLGAVVGDNAEAAFRAVSGVTDIRTHPLWIETGAADPGQPIEQSLAAHWAARPAEFARPATFDLARSCAALGELLGACGLSRGRLGLDLDFLPAGDRDAMAALLAPASLVDGSPVLDRLLMVKHADEIARLRLGAELAEAGLAHMASNLRAGDDAERLRASFRAGVAAEAAHRGVPAPLSWEYIAIGADPWRACPVHEGAVIKADVGCVIDGYSSDTSRNYVFGTPTPAASRLHAMIERAHEAGLAALRPSRPLRDAHAAATASLHADGLTGYSRGHFGHGLGASLFSEQWPFIAADADTPCEAGMVLAFEVPLYVDGVGAFNLEDQLLVTATGIELMTHAPRGLVRAGALPTR